MLKERKKRRNGQHLISDRVAKLSENRDLVILSCKHSVEKIGQRGNTENDGGHKKMMIEVKKHQCQINRGDDHS